MIKPYRLYVKSPGNRQLEQEVIVVDLDKPTQVDYNWQRYIMYRCATWELGRDRLDKIGEWTMSDEDVQEIKDSKTSWLDILMVTGLGKARLTKKIKEHKE